MESQLPKAPKPDLPDAEAVYRKYLETCRRRHIEPVPRDRARELVGEWTATIGMAMASEYSRMASTDARRYPTRRS